MNQKSIIQIVLLLLTSCLGLTLNTLSTFCAPIVENSDYIGYDLASTTRPSAEECCDDCRATPGCTLYVWSRGRCLLKYQIGQQVYYGGARSSILKATTEACSQIEEDTDYPGNDISQTYRGTAEECCSDCKNYPGCVLYVWNYNTCYLKNKKEGKVPLRGGRAASLSQRTSLTVTSEQYGNHPLPTIVFNYVPRAQWISSKEVYTSLFNNFSIAQQARDDELVSESAADLTFTIDSSPVEVFKGVRSPGECAAIAVAYERHYFTYNIAAKMCLLHLFPMDGSVLSMANPSHYTPIRIPQSIPETFRTLTSASSSSACIESCTTASNCVGSTFVDNRCQHYAPSEAAESVAGWVRQPLQFKQIEDTLVVLMATSTLSGIPISQTFERVYSKDQCARLAVNEPSVKLFMFAHRTCYFLEPALAFDKSVQLVYSPSTPVSFGNVEITAPSQSVAATSASSCHRLCLTTKSSCFASSFTNDNLCLLHSTEYHVSGSVGWVIRPPFKVDDFSPTSAQFFVVAHQDDRELFMDSGIQAALSDGNTKVITIYVTAGDAGDKTNWWNAREEGTLAAAETWVRYYGLHLAVRRNEVVHINGHDVAKITIGNSVHYFLRLTEAGSISLLGKEVPTAPLDQPNQVYETYVAFQNVILNLIRGEVKGISNVRLHTSEIQGVTWDHELHVGSGTLAQRVLDSDINLQNCVSKTLYYGYQIWRDPPNLVGNMLELQRFAFLHLSNAITKTYRSSRYVWNDHEIHLGRSFISRVLDAPSTCLIGTINH